MIKVDNIHKSFEENHILNGISFSVDMGDKLAIIGQSGVGKSVLLKHLNGLLKPDKGDVFFDKIKINRISYGELRKLRKNMSMVFQFGSLLDSLTVNENIALALRSNSNLNSKKIMEKVSESLELVGLKDIGNLMPSEISGGMKKRVGVARAIVIEPKYLLYDEPTTGLDPINTDKINQLINKVSTKKMASIIVTHEIKTVYNVANKVIMLYDGSIIFSGSPEELKNSKDKIVKYFVTGTQEKE